MASKVSPGAGASAPAWRQFSFFDATPVKDIHDLDSPPDILKAAPEISTITSSSLGVVVADIHGSVHLLDRDFQSVMSWIAHTNGGRVTHMVEREGYLVTLGEEDTVKSPLLKIWLLQTKDKTGGPVLLRSTKVQLGNRPHPVSTLAASPTLSNLAIGLTDGSVILYRHLDQSLSPSGSLTTLPKHRTVHESPTEPITGLGFAADLSLFVVTTNRVLLYPPSGRSSATVVDEVGCALGCATMDRRNRDIIVAREEAIYLCGEDGRGTCYAYEGPKSSIKTHQTYLIIVSPPFVPKASSASATVRHFVSRSNSKSDDSISKVTVFDPENKLVAYTGTFTNGVRDVISAYGKIYVLCDDGTLSCLQEKPTSAKLQMLYSKNLYVLALNLATSQGLDEESVADIHRQYGDSQYAKGDYDGAMSQFVKTIGWVQPSYVIRKFLDAQRIHNLVLYLQELHSQGLANADHTTLLLNTYTKLKDVSRLDAFIKTTSSKQGELPFDLETAIRVCRQAGYFEHAGYLAKKYERHEDYLRIQIEDAGNFKDALGYLRRLGDEAAESNLARYGRAMLENLPQETTELLIDLCINATKKPGTVEEEEVKVKEAGGPSYLSYLAMGSRHSTGLISDTATTNTAVPPSIKTARQQESRPPSVVDSPVRAPSPPPKRLSPRLYFAHFVDHMEQFVVFLETVALRRWGQSAEASPVAPGDDEQDQIAVWNTLLELYLTLPDMKEKALKVLKSDPALPYDMTHALILCSTKSFTEGLVLLWEKLGMYEDVIRFYIDRGMEESDAVVRCLDLYGPKNRSLYPLVLRHLTSTEALLTKHQTDVRRVLGTIENEGIMPPLAVVQVLSRNGVASVGLVKEWLMDRIKDARTEIHENEQWIDSYKMETAAKLKQVADLSDPEHPRVFHVTRCASCKGQLDLPSVHFMCNHSYHQRCLAGQEAECPNCAREYSVIREIRRNNDQLADQHDIFLAEVEENGFKAVADAFSRGMLNAGRLEEVSG